MAKTIEELLRPVVPKRASDAVAEQIKEMIYTGVLKPEDRLPSERELAIALNTSRMTIREALRMLEGSGFVVIRQGGEGGAFIKKLDGSGMTKTITDLIKIGHISLQDLTEARVGIEMLILDSIIDKITDEQVDLLQKNLEQCEFIHPKNDNDQNKIRPYLIDFHLLLASFAQNNLLRYVLQSIIDFSTNYIRQYAPYYINHYDHISQHQDILEAIKAKDPVRSREALKFHLFAVAKNVEIAMQGSKRIKNRFNAT